jgi:glucosamine 6-phosphate synthetase-like amidotransferase/phosphosugar isomerase protein
MDREMRSYLKKILADSEQIREIIAITKQTIATTRELLSGSTPSSFLGRRTQEPFPQEGQAPFPQPRAQGHHAS